MAAVLEFTRQGRSGRVMIVLAAVYVLLGMAVLTIDAAWWLMAALALPTLPALRDIYINPSAGVRLDPKGLEWHSGRRRGRLELAEIDHMRFDTRWDFSVRVAAVLHDSKRVYLPFESLPPHRAFEAALETVGVRVQRHHFAFF
jgi:hypothetical protein